MPTVTMNQSTESIAANGPFEINVTYSWEDSPDQWEECHGLHNVGRMRQTEIHSIEVVLKGEGFDLLALINQLPEARKDKVLTAIINELSHEL